MGANSAVTKSMVDDAIPTQVADQALGALVGNLYLARVADRNWENVVAQFGETIQIPVRAALTAQDKTAGQTAVLQTPSMTNVSITLGTHKHVALLLEDVAKAFSKLDNGAGYIRDAVVVIAEAI